VTSSSSALSSSSLSSSSSSLSSSSKATRAQRKAALRAAGRPKRTKKTAPPLPPTFKIGDVVWVKVKSDKHRGRAIVISAARIGDDGNGGGVGGGGGVAGFGVDVANSIHDGVIVSSSGGGGGGGGGSEIGVRYAVVFTHAAVRHKAPVFVRRETVSVVRVLV
jgi:hypothetical protein